MPVARAVPVQLLTKTPKPGSLPVPEEVCSDLPTPKLMIRQRHGKLFDELDLSGLDFMGPQIGRKGLPAPCRVSRCIFVGPGGAQVYPLN